MTADQYDAIVIGAGVGGLTVAALLAYEGRRVLLVEKSNRVGGRAKTLQGQEILDNGETWYRDMLGQQYCWLAKTTPSFEEIQKNRLLDGYQIDLGYHGVSLNGRGYFYDFSHTHFKTGDVGMFNKQGLLFITDRKKDLLITSGGKNIAPQKIEAIFKENPIFSQFVVVGDARKYLTALVNIDLDIAKVAAAEKGIKLSQPEELLDDPAFLSLLDEIVAANNKHLASVETIKYYRILKTPLSAATGELSVKLSVKRDVVQKKYADVINSM